MYAISLRNNAPVKLPQAGSCDGLCIRRCGCTFALTSKSQLGPWIGFAANNISKCPDFPLPLGDLCLAAMKSLSFRIGDGRGALPMRNIAHG